jgi:uncharacterized protein (DUF2384 family)
MTAPDIRALAAYVLGDADEVQRFLHAPHPELGGRTPIEAAATESGARDVETILWKAFYGVPA